MISYTLDAISLLLTHKNTETVREWVIWFGNDCGM